MVLIKSMGYCWKALKNVSRSFAVTIPMVEKKISVPIMIGYLEARIIDNFEDEGRFVSVIERIRNLEKVIEIIVNSEAKDIKRHIKELGEIGKKTISNPYYLDLVLNMDKVIAVHNTMTDIAKNAIKRWLSEMTYGMKKFVDIEIKTFSQLDEYCYYVAGTIGGFLTELIINNAKRITKEQIKIMERTKTDFGLFLQKVNIIRDIRADIKRNDKIFWPRELFLSHNLTPEKVVDKKYEKEAIDILSAMLENAKKHISPTMEYINAIPEEYNGYRRASSMNFLMGVETLNKVKNNPDVFYSDKPVKIDKEIKEKILSNPEGYLKQVSDTFVS